MSEIMPTADEASSPSMEDIQRRVKLTSTHFGDRRPDAVRFWKHGHDADPVMWGDFSEPYRVRFRVCQWPTPLMKLFRWVKKTASARRNSLLAMIFWVPLLLLLIEPSAATSGYVIFSLGRVRLVLAAVALVYVAYWDSDHASRVCSVTAWLVFLHGSRVICPDEMNVVVPPLALVCAGLVVVVVGSAHIDVLFPYAFDEPVVSTIEFGVYRGMGIQELRRLLKARFWQFDTNDSWPAWVKSPPPGGEFFSLAAVVSSPELFACKRHGVRTDEGYLGEDDNRSGESADDDVWILPPSMMKPLIYPGTFLQTPRRVFASYRKRIIRGSRDWIRWAASHWAGAILLTVALIETMGVAGVVTGMESAVGLLVIRWFNRTRQFMSATVTEPLRHIYRHGPVFETPFGTFGFWNGASLSQICAAGSGSSFNAAFWDTHHDLCNEQYAEMETRFITVSVCAIVVILIYRLTRARYP